MPRQLLWLGSQRRSPSYSGLQGPGGGGGLRQVQLELVGVTWTFWKPAGHLSVAHWLSLAMAWDATSTSSAGVTDSLLESIASWASTWCRPLAAAESSRLIP